MKNACNVAELDEEIKENLTSRIDILSQKHKDGSFAEDYKDFMQFVSGHITVFAPFFRY